MVFAINAVDTSARNFTAFKSLAQAFNGTNSTGATGTGSGSGGNNGNNSGASSIVINSALGMGSLFAIAAALL